MANTDLMVNQWMVPSKISNKVECVNWGHVVFRVLANARSWKDGKKEKSRRKLLSVSSHLKAQLDTT